MREDVLAVVGTWTNGKSRGVSERIGSNYLKVFDSL